MKFSDILTLEQPKETATTQVGSKFNSSEKIDYGKKSSNEKSEPLTGSVDAILVGGLNYREGDKPTSTQASILKRSLGVMTVKSFDYNASTESILSFLSTHPKTPVFLFSAGCAHAGALSTSDYVDINKLYIIEPYAGGEKTDASVKKAVSNGVPSKNVFVGPNSSRGNGIVSGTVSSQAKTHWDALVSVGSMLSNTLFK